MQTVTYVKYAGLVIPYKICYQALGMIIALVFRIINSRLFLWIIYITLNLKSFFG